MTPDLNQIDFYKVLFWVIIVLVAGFIGQFGKSFAKHIMERFGKKQPRAADPAGTHQPSGKYQPTGTHQIEEQQKQEPSTSPLSSAEAASKDESKIRKKEIKAELKRKKKENK